jgi:hypothetical protein
VLSECSAKRHGRQEFGNRLPFSGRIKALKAASTGVFPRRNKLGAAERVERTLVFGARLLTCIEAGVPLRFAGSVETL